MSGSCPAARGAFQTLGDGSPGRAAPAAGAAPATVRQHRRRVFLGDDAAIVKAQRLRRDADRLWQGEGIVLGVGDTESGIQQAGG